MLCVFYWACEVVWISFRPSEPDTRVRIPTGPFFLSFNTSIKMLEKDRADIEKIQYQLHSLPHSPQVFNGYVWVTGKTVVFL